MYKQAQPILKFIDILVFEIFDLKMQI